MSVPSPSQIFDHITDTLNDVDSVKNLLTDARADISTILNDIAQLPTDIPKLVDAVTNQLPAKLNSIATSVAHDIPASLQAISNAIGALPTDITQLGTDLTSQIAAVQSDLQTLATFFEGAGQEFRDLLTSFFSKCGNILENPVQQLLQDEALVQSALTTLARLLADAIVPIVDTIAIALDQVKGALATELGAITGKLSGILAAVTTEVMKAANAGIAKLGDLPDVLREGTLSACTAVQELYAFLSSFGGSNNLDFRIKAVDNSLTQLFALIGGAQGIAVIENGVRSVSALLADLTNQSNDPAKVLEDFLIGIIYPDKLIGDVFNAIENGAIWKWAELPTGFLAGGFSTWLNTASSYSTDPTVSKLERSYRIRIAAAVDSYFRAATSAAFESSLRVSDHRSSASLLADLVCLFLNTTITFALEPANVPLVDADVDGFEDVGVSFAASAGRQTRAFIKPSIGMLLRGFWMLSVENEVLIELIASTISTVFGGLVEGVTRNVTWTLRVLSRYSGDNAGGLVPIATLNTLERSESLDSSGNVVVQLLEYIAVLRSGTIANVPVLGTTINGFMQDYAGFLDVCFNQYLRESRFPDASINDSVAIRLLSSGLVGNRLTVVADDSLFNNNATPNPVLRVFVLGQVFVMRKMAANYQLVVDLEYVPRRDFRIVVLSSRGGYDEAMQPVSSAMARR